MILLGLALVRLVTEPSFPSILPLSFTLSGQVILFIAQNQREVEGSIYPPHLLEDLRQDAIDEFRRGRDLQGVLLARFGRLKVPLVACDEECRLAPDGGDEDWEILIGNRLGEFPELLLPGQGDDLEIQSGKVPFIHGQHAGHPLFEVSLDLHQVESTGAAN